MSYTSLAKGMIQTENCYTSRLDPIELIVHHTAQCPTEAGRGKFIMEFLKPAARRASAHVGLDPYEIWAGCEEEWTAWAAPGANANGLHMEIAAYAEYGRVAWPSWNDPLIRTMLTDRVVPLTAEWCMKWSIPAIVLEPTDLLAGRKGITDHIRCTQAFGGTHWDCGENYPIYEVVEAVNQYMAGPGPVTPKGDEMIIVTSNTSTVYLVAGNTKTPVIPRNTWPNTEFALNQMVKDGLAEKWLKPAGGYNQEILDCFPDLPGVVK